MAIRPEFRWWMLTVVVLGVLLIISAMALDRPNVVWTNLEPYCPHCRAKVAFYSSRCQTCREQYDWAFAPEDEVAFSPWSLSTLEAKRLHDRVTDLGPEEVTARVGAALDLGPDAAEAFVESVARGLCGYCGGTGHDLADDADKDAPCPVCFGLRECIACRGDRRMRFGDEGAHRALLVYEAAVEELRAATSLPEDQLADEVRRLNETFVRRHAGTVQATRLWFWPDWPTPDKAVGVARRRLETMIAALETE